MVKEIFLDSKDGVKIAINHYDSANPEKVIVICHGSFMCKDAKPFLEMSDDFHEYFDVITMDFRGHGRSAGSFTFTAKEPDDLRVVINFAKRVYPRIGILGFSLGAAIAIIDAARNKDIQSLIAVSAPADVNKIENHFLRKEALIPAIEKFEFGKSPNMRPGNMFLNKIKPVDVIGDISPIPVLFIYGSRDPIIYSRHALALYEKAKMPKRIEKFENGWHAEDLYLKSKSKFIRMSQEWFDMTMSQKIADKTEAGPLINLRNCQK